MGSEKNAKNKQSVESALFNLFVVIQIIGYFQRLVNIFSDFFQNLRTKKAEVKT